MHGNTPFERPQKGTHPSALVVDFIAAWAAGRGGRGGATCHVSDDWPKLGQALVGTLVTRSLVNIPGQMTIGNHFSMAVGKNRYPKWNPGR